MNKNDQQPANLAGGRRGLVSSLRRPGRRAIIFTAAVLLAAGAGYLAYKKYESNKASNKLPSFSYDTKNESDILWANHLISGSRQNNGMAFRLPLNGISRPDSPYKGFDERLIPKKRGDVLVADGLNGEYGLRYVGEDRSVVFQSLIAGLILLPAQQNGFSKEDYFKAALNNLSFRLEGKQLSKVSFSLSGEKAFTNANISSGAKIYQVTAVSRGDAKVAAPIKRMVGELIEIKGKNADYYLLISGTEAVWGSGGKTWQGIKDSLKVDQ